MVEADVPREVGAMVEPYARLVALVGVSAG
jgi:hypothetical protein